MLIFVIFAPNFICFFFVLSIFPSQLWISLGFCPHCVKSIYNSNTFFVPWKTNDKIKCFCLGNCSLITIIILANWVNSNEFWLLFSGDSLHCPPLDRAYKSKPLSHYPEHVPWNPFDSHGICMLSLPQGLRFRTQKHSIEPHFHSFATTREDGKRCHGFSLIFYEEVRNQDICNAMHTLQVRSGFDLSTIYMNISMAFAYFSLES